MEIVAVAFGAALVIGWLERRERARMFPPGPCSHCDQWVYLRGEEWVHADGRSHAEWPGLDYVNFPETPLHPAIPRRF